MGFISNWKMSIVTEAWHAAQSTGSQRVGHNLATEQQQQKAEQMSGWVIETQLMSTLVWHQVNPWWQLPRWKRKVAEGKSGWIHVLSVTYITSRLRCWENHPCLSGSSSTATRKLSVSGVTWEDLRNHHCHPYNKNKLNKLKIYFTASLGDEIVKTAGQMDVSKSEETGKQWKSQISFLEAEVIGAISFVGHLNDNFGDFLEDKCGLVWE